jgi:hypothetical protein
MIFPVLTTRSQKALLNVSPVLIDSIVHRTWHPDLSEEDPKLLKESSPLAASETQTTKYLLCITERFALALRVMITLVYMRPSDKAIPSAQLYH